MSLRAAAYAGGCIAHPVSKHEEITSEVSEYAADINIIMAYYNVLDDWKDERKFSKLLLSLLLKGKMKKACKRQPQKAAEDKRASRQTVRT